MPQPGQTVILKGNYFGADKPKVWIEYPDPNKGIIKMVKCKIIKPLEYQNAKGKTGKSCMDPFTGDSKVRIVIPPKFPDSWNPLSYNIVLYNKTGASSITVPFVPPQINSISGKITGDVLDGVTLTLPGDASSQTVSSSSGEYLFDNLAEGTYTVTPALSGYTFTPESVTVTIRYFASETVNFKAAAGGASNTPPYVGSFSLFTAQDTAVSFTFDANDPDGDQVTYRIKDFPVHGALSGNGADWIYTPDSGYTGNDSFTYIANDGTADSNTGTVDVIISVP
jgi:hypothetical protein